MQRKFKEGDHREDGKVFWRYQKHRGEIWISTETWEHRKQQRKEYRKKCADNFKVMMSKKDPMDRPWFGKYDFARNRYYAGMSSSGHLRWVTKENLDKIRKTNQKSKQMYNQRAEMLPKTTAKIGDRHPEDDKIFVIHIVKNKVFYGNKERLKTKKESLRRSGVKRDLKNLKMRREFLAKMKNRHHRGDSREDGMIFWNYNERGIPVWLQPDLYTVKRNDELQRRRAYRAAKAASCKDDTTPPVSG